jgi:hypothetical protein
MKLVKLENFEVVIDDNLLLLKPFRILYEKDTSDNKSKFMDFITYLYFTYDPRSDYSYITNEQERIDEVCANNNLKIGKLNKQETDCVELYKKLTETTSSKLLEDTKIAVDKVRSVLKNIDMDSFDDKDKVNAVKTISYTISMIPKLVKDLTDAEKIVDKELETSGKMRGAGNKTLMDDGVITD